MRKMSKNMWRTHSLRCPVFLCFVWLTNSESGFQCFISCKMCYAQNWQSLEISFQYFVRAQQSARFWWVCSRKACYLLSVFLQLISLQISVLLLLTKNISLQLLSTFPSSTEKDYFNVFDFQVSWCFEKTALICRKKIFLTNFIFALLKLLKSTRLDEGGNFFADL